MIHSFNNPVEMKNKVILKMNKYNVTYFLGVSLSGEPSEPLLNIRLLILLIIKENQETMINVRSRHIITDLQIQARPHRFKKTSAIPKFKKAFSGQQSKQIRGNHKLHVEIKKFEIQHFQIYAEVLQFKRTYLMHVSIMKVSQFFWHASFAS